MEKVNVQCLITIENLFFLPDLVTDEEEDDEEVYKMAGVMAQCGGLECMLNRLSGIKDFKQGRHLLTVSQKSLYNKTVIFILLSSEHTGTCLEI